MAARRAPYGGGFRLWLQAMAFILAVAALAIPPLLVILSGTASLDPTWTVLRVAALEAFTLISLNIVTGAFRPFFNRFFRASNAQRIHMAMGLAGFSLALAHGITVLVYGVAGYEAGAVYIGPVTLALISGAMVAAFARRRIRNAWRLIHRLNYPVFAAVLSHGLILGYDLRNEALLKALFISYAVVVALGISYRISLSLRGSRDRP